MAFQNEPFKVEVKENETCALCQCGKSENAPYCDGSHKGTGISPFIMNPEKSGDVYVCGCFQSKKKPFCDGSHKALGISSEACCK